MAQQDTRYPPQQKFGVTTVYRDLDLLKKHINDVKKQNVKSLIVIRGLPGSGKTYVSDSLEGVELFRLTDYLPHDNDDKVMYTSDAMKQSHLKMRKDILRLLRNPKNTTPIVVDAPHVYLWELKFYRVQACQYHTQFMVYECRTLFSRNSEERTKQLADININQILTDIITWLLDQSKKNKLYPSQKQLLNYLIMPNAVQKLSNMKPKTNSFCPSVLLNIQLAAWLTSRSPNNIYMDLVWNMLDEWEEITNDTVLWKCSTPTWGY